MRSEQYQRASPVLARYSQHARANDETCFFACDSFCRLPQMFLFIAFGKRANFACTSIKLSELPSFANVRYSLAQKCVLNGNIKGQLLIIFLRSLMYTTLMLIGWPISLGRFE